MAKKKNNFSKNAIVKAANEKDKTLLSAILQDGKLYSVEEAEALMNKWRAKGVNK